MASIIRIKRSSGTAKPASLNWGEMAYVTGIGQYGGTNQYKDRVFLGDDGTNVHPVAGHYYTSMMEHTPGALNGVTKKFDATLELTPGAAQNLDINGGNF